MKNHKTITKRASSLSTIIVKDQLSECIDINVLCLVCGDIIDAELFGKIVS